MKIVIIPKSISHSEKNLEYIDHIDIRGLSQYLQPIWADAPDSLYLSFVRQEDFDFENDYLMKLKDDTVIFFIGLSQKAKEFIKQNTKFKIAAWGNFYNLHAANNGYEVLNKIDVIFDQGWFKGKQATYHDKTFFSPFGFNSKMHDDLSYQFDRTSAYKDLIIFNGSNDQYRDDGIRTLILNELANRGYKIEVISYHKDRDAWEIPNHWTNLKTKLDDRVTYSNNEWDINKFLNCLCVLDIPFVDHSIYSFVKEDVVINDDYLQSVLYRGWGCYKHGALGSRLLTLDCQMHRELGFDETNCSFYSGKPEKFDEIIASIIKQIELIKKEEFEDRLMKQQMLRLLFMREHTYEKRWRFMIDVVKSNI